MFHEGRYLSKEGDFSDGGGFRMDGRSSVVRWKLAVGPGLGEPVRDGNSVYLTSYGAVGKLDLNKGQFLWRHRSLDRSPGLYHHFKAPLLEGTRITFPATNRWYGAPPPDSWPKAIVLDRSSGRILEGAPPPLLPEVAPYRVSDHQCEYEVFYQRGWVEERVRFVVMLGDRMREGYFGDPFSPPPAGPTMDQTFASAHRYVQRQSKFESLSTIWPVPPQLEPVVKYVRSRLQAEVWIEEASGTCCETADLAPLRAGANGAALAKPCDAAVPVAPVRPAAQCEAALQAWRACASRELTAKLGPYPATAWQDFQAAGEVVLRAVECKTR